MYTVSTDVDPVYKHATCFTTIQYFSIAKSTWFLSDFNRSICELCSSCAFVKTNAQQNESNLNQFMIKLLLVHRNLISLHRHRDIVKKNGLENFTIWSTWSNKKSEMTSENNTRSMQLVKLSFSWGTDKRIIIHKARISICVLQTCICIINILVDEVGNPTTEKRSSFPVGRKIHTILSLLFTFY